MFGEQPGDSALSFATSSQRIGPPQRLHMATFGAENSLGASSSASAMSKLPQGREPSCARAFRRVYNRGVRSTCIDSLCGVE